MKVNLIIYDSLRKSRALGQKLVEKCRIPSLVIKRIILLLVFIVLFLSTVWDCNKLKNILGIYFYKKKCLKFIDLTREAFQYFFHSRIKPKHITSVAINTILVSKQKVR